MNLKVPGAILPLGCAFFKHGDENTPPRLGGVSTLLGELGLMMM